MFRLLLVLTPLSLCASASIAAPKINTETGVIAFLDPEHDKIGLSDGIVLVAPRDWPFNDYETGDEVSVTYEVTGAKRIAIRIVLEDDADPEAL